MPRCSFLRSLRSCVPLKLLVSATAVLFLASTYAEAQNWMSKGVIQSRIEELKDSTNIPDNQILLEREYDRVQTEIDQVSQIIGMEYQSPFASTLPDEVIADFKKFADGIAKVKCGKDNLQTISNLYGEFRPTVFKVSTMFGGIWPPDLGAVAFVPGISQLPATDSEALLACQKAQEFFVVDRVAGITKVFSDAKTKLTQGAETDKELKKDAATLLESLKKRRLALRDKISSAASPQQTLTQSLPYIVGIIGAASVLAMAMVRLFPPTVQMEWVASGQVIQFVTVMILLSAIMALGLSNILHENTLGTLLGGIAGYILAQGVGRAAAREATRRASEDSEGIVRAAAAQTSASGKATPN